jgi:REP element-mobilizing transposase RayT
MFTGRPHASNLRKGRFSAPGVIYFITNAAEVRGPLLRPAGRELIINGMKWTRDHGRIWLLPYVVMDDHFHFLFMLREGRTLATIMHSLKSYTSHAINKLYRRQGPFWQPGYHDHAIRDRRDFWNHVHYTHNNPVRCGWVERPEDYAWSTAHPSRHRDVDWEVLQPLGWSTAPWERR